MQIDSMQQVMPLKNFKQQSTYIFKTKKKILIPINVFCVNLKIRTRYSFQLKAAGKVHLPLKI